MILVTGQEVHSGEWRLPLAKMDIAKQADDSGDLNDERNGTHLTLINIDNLYFSKEKEGYGLLPRDNLYRFIAGIEEERSIQAISPSNF